MKEREWGNEMRRATLKASGFGRDPSPPPRGSRRVCVRAKSKVGSAKCSCVSLFSSQQVPSTHLITHSLLVTTNRPSTPMRAYLTSG